MIREFSRRIVPARFAFLKAWRASRRAFTLVELMVVLAIIAMLAGLLTLTVRDGIERAKSTRCRNNLRQFGIAIGKYKSDCDGYFYETPSGGASRFGGTKAIRAGSDRVIMARDARVGIDLLVVGFDDGVEGGMGDSLGFPGGSYNPDFIQNYVLAGNEQDVLHCPKVDHREIFDTNSPYFKGFQVTRDEADLFDIYSEDSVGKIVSYALGSVQGRPHDGVVAFIDWNAPFGWGATIGNVDGIATWVMRNDTVGAVVRDLYGQTGDSKGAPAYRTEIGYHHRIGGKHVANYVAVDGHVGSISSNAPGEDFSSRKLFTGI